MVKPSRSPTSSRSPDSAAPIDRPLVRIATYREIAEEVAERLAAGRRPRGEEASDAPPADSDVAQAGDPFAPWPEEVIVPSRGVAEAITSALLSRMPNGVAGLRMRFLPELAESIVIEAGEAPHVADDRERRLAMRTAIRAADHSMMESRGMAAMLDRSYRDVRDNGLTLGELAKRIASAQGLRNRRRSETILGAWREYERLIEQLGAIDPADLLARTTALAETSTTLPPQILAGFYDMTGAQLRLIQALFAARRIAAVWIPTAAPFARPFREAIAQFAGVPLAETVGVRSSLFGSDGVRSSVFGESETVGVRPSLVGESEKRRPDPKAETRRPDPKAEERGSDPLPVVVQYDTRLAELRGVAREAGGLVDGRAGGVGIVARSLGAYDVRLLNRFAGESGVRTALADEVRLVAHRVGRGAVTLLRLREGGFPRGDVLELVRSGLRVATRIGVDAVDGATRRARIAGGTSEELRGMRRRTPIIDDYIALVAELEAMTATIDVDFLSRLAGMFRLESETDLAAAERLDAIAALFRRAAVWGQGVDVASLVDAIENESIALPPANGDEPVIWAGDVMSFRGRSFAHLFVVRMQDDVFPQRRTEDPLLPDADRRILGLREIGDGREEEDLLFSLLAAGTSERLRFSFAAGDGLGKSLRPSRYIRHLPRLAAVERRESPGEVPPSSMRRLQLLVQSGKRSVFDGYIGPIATEALDSFSPTQLEDFGECPQKFLFKHILGVRDFDQPERELQINHREKGTIDHRILERFYRQTSPEESAKAAAALPRLPATIIERLDSIIDDQFDELERDMPPFNRTVRDIERRATKRILREFLARDLADLETQRLVPRWFEYRFGTKHRDEADHPQPFFVEAGGVPVRVEGTIDRIDTGDAVDESRYRIVDYKSGKALRHTNLSDKIDRGVRLQLALYAMAVTSFFDLDPACVSGTIKPLVVGDVKDSSFAFELREKRATLMETLEIFMKAIINGQFPAFPNENDSEFNSCKYCPVNHSCRTKHDPEERYATQQLNDPRTLLGGARE